MKKVTLKALWRRLILRTPSFFKRVQKVSVAIAGLCAIGLTIPWIDAKYSNWLEIGVALPASWAVLAQLAVENPEEIHKPKDDANS